MKSREYRLPVMNTCSNLVDLVAQNDAIELLAEELTDFVSMVDRRDRRAQQVRG